MVMEARRTLTPEEKKRLREQWPKCYICEESFEGYDDREIEFDHIHAYAGGFPQDLAYFAPVHASRDPAKLNCHRAKGAKSPLQYKEERRILRMLENVKSLGDICPIAKPVSFHLDKDKMVAMLNGQEIKVFKQTVRGVEFYYFFHELSLANIESDDEIQLRPLDARITGLVFHLRECPQLLPSLARLETKTGKIKVFDGQHKAVAQLIGNSARNLPFIVFIDPDVNLLRNTVLEAHTTFVQQRYQPSHIDRKLNDVFKARIEEFQGGGPYKPYSEKDILGQETRAKQKEYVEAAILDGLRGTSELQDAMIARVKREQGSKPILYSSLERFVRKFAKLDTIEWPTGHPQNYREAELVNLTFILGAIRKETLDGKWEPNNPDNEAHKLARRYYYDHAVRVWLDVLEESISHGLSQMAGRRANRPICYRPQFSDLEKNRIVTIVSKLFMHGLWLNPSNRTVLSSSYAKDIKKLFADQGLDYIHCTGLG